MNSYGIQRLPRQFSLATILLSACLFSLPLSAQVIIKNTVVISPREIIGAAAPHRNREALLSEDSFVTIDCGFASWVIPNNRIPRNSRGKLHLRADEFGYDSVVVQCYPCNVSACWWQGDYAAKIGPLGPGTLVTMSSSDCDWVDSTIQLQATSDTTWIVLFNNRYCGIARFHRGVGGAPYPNVQVRFTPPTSSAVYPTYPGHNDSTTKRNWSDLEVSVNTNRCALSNHSVQVNRPVLVDSGGHSHDGGRPMGRSNIPLTRAAFLTHSLDRRTVKGN